ncbi:MAG: 3-hydroxyacyl-[acyl-carrier-protein] dehydratase [Saprospiraceae bacterium]|jgi:3-hydroxyacyl-[acyl-carrier-protein] dehydratase
MKVSKEQIEYFIPQRAPFIMVDNLIEATPDKFETDFQILSDNIFLEEGVLREFALIENIAQSSAAGIGFLNKSSNIEGPKDGFIGGISKLKVYELPKVNDKIYTIVTKLHQLGNMYLLKGENFVNGRILIECEVKLAGINYESY